MYFSENVPVTTPRVVFSVESKKGIIFKALINARWRMHQTLLDLGLQNKVL